MQHKPLRRRALAAGAALSAAAALSIALAPAASANTAGQPGTPSPGIPVYTENFENGMGTAPVKLTDYTGATGMTYDADSAYDGINCNGLIVNYNTPQPSGTLFGCQKQSPAGDNAFPKIRSLARQLGGLPGGPGNPADNHAVTAWTHEGTEPANAIVAETGSPISLTSSNRFITFSIDTAAASCTSGWEHPELKFYLLDGGTETAAFNSPIDPCTGRNAGSDTRIGTQTSNKAVLFAGGQLGIRLRNGSSAGSDGNDFAFDNIRVLDVTPQLDTAFDADTITTGDTSQLTFTITNTDELAEKDGWSLSAPLPTGVTATGPGSTTCAASNVTAGNGATSVSVTGGDIATGVTSCTVTIPVTAADPGTYTLHNYDLTVTGIDRPANATLTVAPEAGAPIVSGEALGAIGGAALLIGGALLLFRRRRAAGAA